MNWVTLVFNKNIQASNFYLVPYLKCFGAPQLHLVMVDLYYSKAIAT